MRTSESIKEIATAMAKAQEEIEHAKKNAANPHFKSTYADLAEVISAVRPIYNRHGISISQHPSYDGGVVTVETVMMHLSGEFVASAISAPVTKQDAQGIGSAITYCRRYALAAIACIAQEDDDANAAVGGAGKKQSVKADVKLDPAILETLNHANSMEELSAAWQAIPVGLRHAYADAKDFRKNELAAGGM